MNGFDEPWKVAVNSVVEAVVVVAMAEVLTSAVAVVSAEDDTVDATGADAAAFFPHVTLLTLLPLHLHVRDTL